MTATATAVNGTTANASIPISVTGSADWHLNTTPASGISPLTVSFSLFTERPITQVSLDADGDGTIDYSGANLDQHPFIFFQPGVYVPKVTFTDSQGVQAIVETVIEAFDQNALNGSLVQKWTNFKASLTANDIDGALLFIATAQGTNIGASFRL